MSRHVHHLWAGRQKVLRAAEGVGYLFEAIPSGVIGWQDDHVGGFDPGRLAQGSRISLRPAAGAVIIWT